MRVDDGTWCSVVPYICCCLYFVFRILSLVFWLFGASRVPWLVVVHGCMRDQGEGAWHLVQRRALHWLVLQAAQSFTNRPSQHVPGLLNPRYPMFSQHHLSKRGSTENFAIYTVTSFYTICVPSTHQIQNTKILKFKRDSTDDCAIYTDLHLFTQSQPSVCLQPIIDFVIYKTQCLW